MHPPRSVFSAAMADKPADLSRLRGDPRRLYNGTVGLICAPDSFKGSLSAARVAAAMGIGARRANRHGAVVCVPLADGGEGTVEALVAARGGNVLTAAAHDPLGRPVSGGIGNLGGGTFVLEMAAASGLPLLRPDERDPFRASTFGTGELLKAALDDGAREVILGVGGSATVDGGAGALQALGARLLDVRGAEIGPGNRGLADLDRLDLSGLDGRLAGIRLRIACDVVNPLTGPAGAAAVFGPQKGAGPADIQVLDRNLARFAQIVARDTGSDVATQPGSGAAGGLAAGLMAVGATMEQGIETVLEAARFDEHLQGAALVITGEGCLDAQTASGKVISGVLAHASRANVPVVAIAGAVRWGEIGALYEAGMVAAFAIPDGPMSSAKAFARTATLVQRVTESAVRLWLASAGSRR